MAHYFQAQSPQPENQGSLQRPELPSRKNIGKQIKNCVSLMKRALSHKNGVLSCEEGIFPFQKGCGIEKISVSYLCMGFFIIIYYSLLLPLEIPKRTIRNTPFQARTAFLLFFYSCQSWWFDSQITDKPVESPLESLYRQEELII